MSFHQHYDAAQDRRWTCLVPACLLHDAAPQPTITDVQATLERAVTRLGDAMTDRELALFEDRLGGLRHRVAEAQRAVDDAHGVAQALERQSLAQQVRLDALTEAITRHLSVCGDTGCGCGLRRVLRVQGA